MCPLGHAVPDAAEESLGCALRVARGRTSCQKKASPHSCHTGIKFLLEPGEDGRSAVAGAADAEAPEVHRVDGVAR